MDKQYSEETRNATLSEFITPPGLAKKMVDVIPERVVEDNCELYVLDPGANSGMLGRFIRARWPFAVIVGIEIMDMPKPPWYDIYLNKTDFLVEGVIKDMPGQFDIVIQNPPYTINRRSVAHLFIQRSMNLLRPGGVNVALLRTAYAHSKTRWESDGIHNEYPWKHRLSVVPRPSFYQYDPRTKYFGQRKTNQWEYDIYYFEKGYRPSEIELTMRRVFMDTTFDKLPEV